MTGGSLTSEAIAYVSLCAHCKQLHILKINLFQGVIDACDTLLERMKPIKDKMNNPTWEQVVAECFSKEILLTAYGL